MGEVWKNLEEVKKTVKYIEIYRLGKIKNINKKQKKNRWFKSVRQ